MEKVNKLGIKNIITREPGGSSGAELIRKILVNGPVDKWQPVTEALLHYAARNEHLKTKILPALEKDIWVLCDRFSDSTKVQFDSDSLQQTLSTEKGQLTP